MTRVWVEGLFPDSVSTWESLQIRKGQIEGHWLVNNTSTLESMSLSLSRKISAFIAMGGLKSTLPKVPSWIYV